MYNKHAWTKIPLFSSDTPQILVTHYIGKLFPPLLLSFTLKSFDDIHPRLWQSALCHVAVMLNLSLAMRSEIWAMIDSTLFLVGKEEG